MTAAGLRRGLPLALFPRGALNHFARDVGLDSLDDTAEAVEAGQAVGVDVGTAAGVPFLNTASIGAYPEIVRRRDQLIARFGKWLAAAIASGEVMRRHEPLTLRLDGESQEVWTLFVGNGEYVPRGPFPVRRLRLDDGLLQVQYIRVGRLARVRAVLAALGGVTTHSRAYESRHASALGVRSLDGALEIALDGEPGAQSTEFQFGKWPGRLVVYRPVRMSRRGSRGAGTRPR